MAAYLTHQQKVLRLYKRSLRHLESWCIFRERYRFYACLMRARFEEHKNEKDMVKATMLLKLGEEEFWDDQHSQPYIFPDSPGGTSYERYDCYKADEWVLDTWHPSEKAMYPDYFSKREQWKKLRMESWDKEVGSTAYCNNVSHTTTTCVLFYDLSFTMEQLVPVKSIRWRQSLVVEL
uniref:NADH dehydrogenase [ubiquinone] 1 beta subcomplex subunit 9 n=1 Tax=Stegastes partitus TaxID=144197 RepID=A0A3B4YUZ3_9TELE